MTAIAVRRVLLIEREYDGDAVALFVENGCGQDLSDLDAELVGQVGVVAWVFVGVLLDVQRGLVAQTVPRETVRHAAIVTAGTHQLASYMPESLTPRWSSEGGRRHRRNGVESRSGRAKVFVSPVVVGVGMVA